MGFPLVPCEIKHLDSATKLISTWRWSLVRWHHFFVKTWYPQATLLQMLWEGFMPTVPTWLEMKSYRRFRRNLGWQAYPKPTPAWRKTRHWVSCTHVWVVDRLTKKVGHRSHVVRQPPIQTISTNLVTQQPSYNGLHLYCFIPVWSNHSFCNRRFSNLDFSPRPADSSWHSVVIGI